MKGSLRLRLLLGTSLASACILGLLGAAIYFSMWRSLLKEFDSALLTKARALAAMAEQKGNKVKFESDYLQLPEFTRREKPEFFQALLADGKVIAASPSMQGQTLNPPAAPEAGAPAFGDAILPDGRHGRMIALSFTPRNERDDDDHADAAAPPPQPVTLVLASETHALRETLENLRWLLASLCGGAIVVSGLVLFAIVGRAMRPVQSVARQIESLNETDLASRLEAGGVPMELHPVIDKLNGLLQRLEQAFAREKSFTADVAHELRTPLAGIQTTLQVCQSRPRESREYVTAIDKSLKMTADMSRVIESLLLLVRADAGQLAVKPQPLDLSLLIRECWGQFQSRAAERDLRAQIVLPDACPVESDPDKIRILLNNLLDNAVSHCDAGATVRVELSSSAGKKVIEVSNSGSRLEPREVAKVFDRFWRGDTARSQTGLHCGLGLSLCARLATLLGGTISAESKDGIFSVRWTLP